MDTFLKSIKIKNFRGITDSLEIVLCKERGRTVTPYSIIIFGENGVGKSSIVDAIELGLQGKIYNSKLIEEEELPTPVSLYSKNDAEIEFTLSTNKIYNRVIKFNENSLKFEPIEAFSKSPIVIRRRDIVNFWATPSRKRLLFFYDFFPKEISDETISDEIIKIENQKRIIKDQRIEIIKKINSVFLAKTEYVYFDNKLLDIHINKFFFGGVTKRERKKLDFKEPEKYVLIKSFINELKQLNDEIKRLNTSYKSKTNPNQEKLIKSKVHEFFSSVSDDLTTYFQLCTPDVYENDIIKRIDIEAGTLTDAYLSFEVILKNGVSVSPQKFFSEANLDLLGILVYMSVAKQASENGQAKFIILDDILQSVDTSIRNKFADYILSEFKDWQIVFTVHDHYWKERLTKKLKRGGLNFFDYHITNWTFDKGPKVGCYETEDIELQEAIRNNNIKSIAVLSGRLLEMICNELSYIMPIAVPRKVGEKYTLGDLWPLLKRDLKTSSIKNKLDDIDEIDENNQIRNKLGAHFDERGLQIPHEDVVEFGKATLILFNKFYCSNCGQWVKSRGNKLVCNCGQNEILKRIQD